MKQSDYDKIGAAITYLENHFKEQPSLEAVAKELKTSKFHLQRLFKRWAGISPKKFLQFLTIEYTKELLQDSTNTFAATYKAGLSSTSRLHELFLNIEAVTPHEYKQQGKGLKIYYGFHDSPFGTALIAATSKGICALFFIDTHTKEARFLELRSEWPYAEFIESADKTEKYQKLLNTHHINNNTKFFLKGTNFQIQVWKALLSIPSGQATTYEAIAKAIGHPKAVRAVGNAVAHNPISFIIPCHRAINKIGIIGKYRWGSTRKKAMIGWEAAKQTIS